MSYTLASPCWGCTKEKTCTDQARIQGAIAKIHETTYEQGHQGAGMVVLHCCQQNKERA